MPPRSQDQDLQSKVDFLTHYDPITKLPNHTHLINTLLETLTHARTTGQSGAMLLVDLDGFRRLKDTYGYLVGDELLRQAGHKIQQSIPANAFLSRLGGDEFAVILREFKNLEDLDTLITQVFSVFNQVWTIFKHDFFMMASIGVAVFPEEKTEVLDLLRNASSALFQAKELGRNQYRIYEKGSNEKLIGRYNLEINLRHALLRDEFELHYQPQIEGNTGTLVGFEALIRWNHPARGVVSPGEFIPIAEDTGLIIPISEWVILTACEQNRRWIDLGLPPVKIAVNISAKQLQKPGFLKFIQAVLQKTALPSGLLELEITEGALIKAVGSVALTLHLLRAMGIKIALDDFGTGYSSLSYLTDLHIDKIKIDRSFIVNLEKKPASGAIINAIIVLAQTMKLSLVAEGVETLPQRAFLLQKGCSVIQGFLYSRPLGAQAAEAILRQGRIEISLNEVDSYTI